MVEPGRAPGAGPTRRQRYLSHPPREEGRCAGVGRRRWWPYYHHLQHWEQRPHHHHRLPPQHQGGGGRGAMRPPGRLIIHPWGRIVRRPPPQAPPPGSFVLRRDGAAQKTRTQEEAPTWRRRRRPIMELPEPGWWWKVCVGLLLHLLLRRPRWGWGRRRVLAAAGLTCCALVALCSLSSLRDLLPVGGREEEEGEGEEGEAPVTVLLWWKPFGDKHRLVSCLRRFNVSACHLTTARNRLLEAKAVLFHHRDLHANGLAQLPRARHPAQLWVWMNFESPSHSRGLRDLAGIFNWTMSYRVDSDVFVPYGYLRPKRAPASRLDLPKKTKLVAWVISNWNKNHARVLYYHQLKNYLPIDVYGSHRMKLKGGSVVATVSEYKFYLAFENSQHRDYITEKFWRNAFKSWAVPVVLGPPRSNYELFAPSDSFIHVDDFSGPKQLARYLRYLDKDERQYNRYFAWRKHYDVSVTSFWNEHCCRVCDVVRTAGKQPKTIQNLANWFEH